MYRFTGFLVLDVYLDPSGIEGGRERGRRKEGKKGKEREREGGGRGDVV